MSDPMIIFGGLAVVFTGMVAIIGLLYLIAFVTRAIETAQKKRADKKTAANAETAKKIGENVASAVLAAQDTNDSESGMSEEELTAIITAAVAAYLEGESSKAPRFTVTSFKRV